MQIILPIIAFLIVVSAWRAWRGSPLYSGRKALKLVGIFLLIVAVILGVSMGIFNGPLSHSPVTLAISGILTIVVVGTGASGILIRITDSHIVQLPPSVRLVTSHRRKVYRWMWGIVVYLLINAVAALLVPSSWRWLPLALGGLMLLGCGPALIAFYMRARRFDLGLSAVTAAPWVHWQYTPAQWASWAKNQLAWELSQLQPIVWNRRDGLVVLIIALISGGCIWFIIDASTWAKIIMFAACWSLVLALLSMVTWFNRSNCERRYRRLLTAPAEAYFGAEGVFCNVEYSPWVLSGAFLLEATALRGPPARVVLIFQTFNGSSSTRVARRILIPEDRESDLGLLQQKLRVSCPTAIVRLFPVVDDYSNAQ